VHPHPHLDFSLGAAPVRGGKARLRRDRGVERGPRAVEDGEERVALAIDSPAAGCGEGLADQAVMDCQELAVPVAAERLQQLRRALDVGEDEGDGAGGKRLSSFAQV
jgi:hypothetical protein